MAEGSSESEVDRLVTKTEESSDEDDKKQMDKGDQVERNEEVRVSLAYPLLQNTVKPSLSGHLWYQA